MPVAISARRAKERSPGVVAGAALVAGTASGVCNASSAMAWPHASGALAGP